MDLFRLPMGSNEHCHVSKGGRSLPELSLALNNRFMSATL
jgi:hypothetical protein